MTLSKHLGLLLLLSVFGVPPLVAQAQPESLPTVAEKTEGMTAQDGFLRLWPDRRAGRVWLELPPPAGPRGIVTELLYVEGLRTGLGSNPVGLDRSQLGSTRWLALRRIGPRVLLEQLNPRYRARIDRPAEQRATFESFATSVLWAEDIGALDEDGRALVDLTGFLVRDAHAVEATLDRTGQGEFELDPGRSVVDFEQLLAFPDNVEAEVLLTYGGSKPGAHVRSTAPSPTSLSFVLHHSLIRLPDDGYTPRRFDPRAGSFAIEFSNYAAPLDAPLVERWISRHRMRDGEPIVFYVDRGVPEPVRGALIDGAGSWADAFREAGFENGFRVQLLPEDAHPLDVRYNVIQWVHRSTRGWSYGGGVIDPRTGEILKGHVLLGSLRVRQDRLLFEGLAGTEKVGSGEADDPIELALARIRQLSAHEVGHALGFTHNFAASTYADRASVMDYPAPLIGFDGDRLDFSRAYAVGAGVWDRHATRYAYSEFAPGADEDAELEAIVREGLDRGYTFLTDADARPAGASDPRANLWDNGDDPVLELKHSLRVRRHALDRFGERNIAVGQPLAHLQEVLAPLYFHHRFQLDAALKAVGGMEYGYALRGDGQVPTRVVSVERQREALEVILTLLDPATLDLSAATVALLVPRPHGEGRNREMFPGSTSPAFDVQAAAAAATAQAIDGLLQNERLGRLAEQHRRDPDFLGVDELLAAMVERAFSARGQDAPNEIDRLIQSVLVARLIGKAVDAALRPTIRAEIESALRGLGTRLGAQQEPASATFLAAQIRRFLDRPAGTGVEPTWAPPAQPPGSPIGAGRLAGCSAGP